MKWIYVLQEFNIKTGVLGEMLNVSFTDYSDVDNLTDRILKYFDVLYFCSGEKIISTEIVKPISTESREYNSRDLIVESVSMDCNIKKKYYHIYSFQLREI